MTTSPTPRAHPVHDFTSALHRALDRVSGVAAWAMTAAEQAEALVELSRATARLEELRLRVLAAGDRNEIGSSSGATNTAAWLAGATRQTHRACHTDVRLALALDEPLMETTRQALADGRLTREHAQVVATCVEDLPADEVTDDDRVRVQQHLVTLAADHDARRLRACATRIFEVIAPADADRREGETLQARERRARDRARLSTADNGDGTTSGWFTLPTTHAEMLTKALQALVAPRTADPDAWLTADGRKAPYRALLGRAFVALIEHLPTDGLPRSGGLAPGVVVTVDLEALRSGLVAAALDTGGRISVSEVRRMACNARIIPMVLGGSSQPLDVGRARRLHTPAQRQAMVVRDQGCTTVGCDRPPAWCEVHHDKPWSEGGVTSVQNGRLLCPRHHHLAHDARYRMTDLPDGRVAFHRRT